MIKIDAITEGAIVSETVEFKVVKVNKKSVIVEDPKGYRLLINSRDFAKFQVHKTTTAKKSTPKKETSSSELPTLRGRFPKWATSTPKKDFVRESRAQGVTATFEAYKEYREFKKDQRNS